MKDFVRNNINFRIISSNAIAQFKASQAFDFHEITTNKAYFSQAEREIVLLEYDLLFKLIMRYERYFINLLPNESPIILNPQVQQDIYLALEEIEEIINSHQNMFDPELSEFMNLYHNSSGKVLQKFLTEALKNEQAVKSFPYLVSYISLYLQVLMFSLFEYDNNVVQKRETAFISYSAFCEKLRDMEIDLNPLLDRAKYYQKKYNTTEFVVKNYVRRPAYISKCITELESAGIKVLNIENNFE